MPVGNKTSESLLDLSSQADSVRLAVLLAVSAQRTTPHQLSGGFVVDASAGLLSMGDPPETWSTSLKSSSQPTNPPELYYKRWSEHLSRIRGSNNRIRLNPVVTLPAYCSLPALCGEADPDASLKSGRVVFQSGLLQRARAGVMVLNSPATQSHELYGYLARMFDADFEADVDVEVNDGASLEAGAPANETDVASSHLPSTLLVNDAGLNDQLVKQLLACPQALASVQAGEDGSADELSENAVPEELVSAAMLDRLSFMLELVPDMTQSGDSSGQSLRQQWFDHWLGMGDGQQPGCENPLNLFFEGEQALQKISFCQVARAGQRLARVATSRSMVKQVFEIADAFGIDSMRTILQTVALMRASAAWHNRAEVAEEDLVIATQLCLLWRAKQLPANVDETVSVDESCESRPAETGNTNSDDLTPLPADANQDNDPDLQKTQNQPVEEPASGPHPASPAERMKPDQPASKNESPESVPSSDEMESVLAMLPENLLSDLVASMNSRSLDFGAAAQSRKSGGAARKRSGSFMTTAGSRNKAPPARGRIIKIRRGQLDASTETTRLNLLATVKAAIPWQRQRASESGVGDTSRILIRKEDIRINHYQPQKRHTTVFVVDASGSAARQRLAEAKGAVELLLAECYVRRDSVALITFQGARPSVVLPPTRSLVRARRELVQMPCGGGTPLAAALDETFLLCAQIAKSGDKVSVVLLTDGKANVNRAGIGGRQLAQSEALEAAAVLAGAGVPALLIDISPRSNAFAVELSQRLQARYLALPRAGSEAISAAVMADQSARNKVSNEKSNAVDSSPLTYRGLHTDGSRKPTGSDGPVSGATVNAL